MRILKFGGSSVGTPERIERVINIAISALKREQKACGLAEGRYPIALVVSAFQGITDLLIKLGTLASRGDESFRGILEDVEKRHLDTVNKLVPVSGRSSILANVKVVFNELEDVLQGVFLIHELSPRTKDLIMSFGERLSAYIISEVFKVHDVEAQFMDARDVLITDDRFGNARTLEISEDRIRDYFASHSALQVITGFIGSTESRETTTLGRGGSDYTASIFGTALNATEIEIWTDVDGMLTADPAKVKKAFPLEKVSFEEAMELCHFGAKVLYPPTIQPALLRGIPIRLLNTFNPSFSGTLISRHADTRGFAVTGVTSITNASLLLLEGSGMVGVSGVSSRLFGALARRDISVILITQASSEHTICFAVEPSAAEEARHAIDEEFSLERKAGMVDPIRVESNMAIVSIVGEKMRNTPGISGTLFSALGRNGINVVAIAQGSSERIVSVVISKQDEVKALNALHDAFFLSGIRAVHLYLIGTGLIGSALLGQISVQQKALKENLSLELKLVGLINSRKMLIDEEGIPLDRAVDLLAEKGGKGNILEFIEQIKQKNLPNSVFIDCTASEDVVNNYESILDSSVSIVTPNKKAQSGDLFRFNKIKSAAKKHRVNFLYETSVGAGLPIINTLNDILLSGDVVENIEAVLSGTLSYIFNTFDGSRPFSDVIREAKEKGLTEPDPREDLSGLDVARKLLILSREVGYNLELKDISLKSVLPKDCSEAKSIEEFFVKLKAYDSEFESLRKAAFQKGKKLCYVASLECGASPKAVIELMAIDPSHPFYSLSGSDNIISFTTERYNERPLVIKGPGAGAQVTAAGLFADVIRSTLFSE